MLSSPYLQILPNENEPALETMFIILSVDAMCFSQGMLEILI